MRKKPFAYQAILYGSRDRGTFPTLAALVEEMERNQYPPDWVEVWAWYEGSGDELVSEEEYSDPNPPTREEAETFVRERLVLAAAGSPETAAILGAFRASIADPPEKQVEDYIRTGPRKWRALEGS